MIKILGLILMCVDHVSVAYFNSDVQQYWLRAIGRGSAPIFLFLAGYASSYRFKWDILLLAILVGASGILATGLFHTQNILFTILLCRAIFYWLEKHGKKINNPYQWYFGCLAWLVSMAAVEYGSIGFLFAICGYMQRYPERYGLTLRNRFMVLVFGSYAALNIFFAQPPLNPFITLLTLAFVGLLLARIHIDKMPFDFLPAKNILKILSRYSGYVYAANMIAIDWLTK